MCLCRKDSPHINNVVRPYDWTFTPEGYAGTVEPELNRVKEGEGEKEVRKKSVFCHKEVPYFEKKSKLKRFNAIEFGKAIKH